ncbi:DUF4236 domain-containing protein [Amycolatopsis sp. CFH S0078]|uniref:DUF4236 domain-containing protein n=1 Tax=Amycolatopsis sp. CFH S0078 TaxID=1644108 RepID=UPI00106DF785|nr:DUF4236 domain-containing protein [Amycolatopsis sp. CFH S0078]
MGWVFRKRIRTGRSSWLNASKRIGRVTVNSRGRATIRLGRGLSFRFGGRR